MLINCFFTLQQKCTCAYTNLLHAIEIVGQLGMGLLIEIWVKISLEVGVIVGIGLG